MPGGVDDAFRLDHPGLVDQKGERRRENLIAFGQTELLLQQHGKTGLDLGGPLARRLQVAAVHRKHLEFAAALQPIQLRHDALTGTTTGLVEDEQRLAASAFVQREIFPLDAGKREVRGLGPFLETAAADATRRRQLNSSRARSVPRIRKARKSTMAQRTMVETNQKTLIDAGLKGPLC